MSVRLFSALWGEANMLRSRAFRQLVLMVVLALVAGAVSADTQNVVPSPLTQNAAGAGVAVDFTVVYTTTPSQETTGIGVRVHFDSTELAPLNGGGAGFRTGTFNPNGSLTGCQAPAVEGGAAVDSDPDTDMFTACAWADLNPDDDAEGDPGEPGELWPAGPSNLFTLHFLTTADHDGSFVNFTTSGASASCPGGCIFAPTPFQVIAPGTPTVTPSPTTAPRRRTRRRRRSVRRRRSR